MTETMPPTPSRPHGAPFRHELYPYRGQDQFLSGTLDYIHEALEADEAVVVAVPEDKTSLLRGELADESAVTFVDATTAGPNPGRHIAAWSAWMHQRGEGGRPVRGIGETAWRQARSAAHLSELRYHEWLMNRAFARSSTWSMLCPYDAADEDQDALRSLSRCHPQIHRDGQYTLNEVYLTGEEYAFDDLDAPCDPFQELSYTHGDLGAIRSKVSQCATDAGVTEDRLAKLAVAVTEIATNSIRHGGGHGTLRTWAQDETFLCELRDSGYIPDAMTGRTRPEANQVGGRGLWLAHQLCDLVEIRSTPDQGTTIRLHMDAPQR
ncbi:MULTISPECIES: sensor histidine kinase [Streptomyces]|uniref:Anti-sigma regulatory factor n=1 Tax=Streptomyces microflavus TaxID=1919 RepID=A0A7J0D5D5_STRMI|nr:MULTISPECIES: sensor histidine kinase [Streptomyces]MCX4657172.1 sensor histidine kinase [Streptomyces microflavus]MDX2982278.1 sensor histidine kinase [Streptomyces sp. NRRL_B-2249]WSS32160.1 sensor histidine kinase [Streptomyces microflavus]WST19309.1 sensor histidine kinase [Streptomyces microflavus]GFN09962.1 anti-sigma regulatory factor [Streptomyces microflavus]